MGCRELKVLLMILAMGDHLAALPAILLPLPAPGSREKPQLLGLCCPVGRPLHRASLRGGRCSQSRWPFLDFALSRDHTRVPTKAFPEACWAAPPRAHINSKNPLKPNPGGLPDHITPLQRASREASLAKGVLPVPTQYPVLHMHTARPARALISPQTDSSTSANIHPQSIKYLFFCLQRLKFRFFSPAARRSIHA